MTVRALRWWSEPQLALMAARVERELAGWSEDWGVPLAPRVSARLAHQAAPGAPGWQALAPAAGGTGDAWWCSTAEPERAVQAAMFGETPRSLPGIGQRPIAASVVQAGWQACLARLAQALCAAGPNDGNPAAPPATDALPWSGAVRVEIAAPNLSVWLHLGPAAAAALVPGAAAVKAGAAADAAPALVPLDAALAQRRLLVRVELDELELDVGSLQALAVGDVIRLPHLLAQPLNVRAEGTAMRCAAYLGQVDGARAVELMRRPSN